MQWSGVECSGLYPWPITERNETEHCELRARHAQRFHMKNISLSRCAAALGVGVGAAVAVGVDSSVVCASRRQVHEIYGKRQPNRARDCSLPWPRLGLARLGLAWASVNFHTRDEVSN